MGMSHKKDDIWAKRLEIPEYKTEEPDGFIIDWIKRLAVKGHKALDIGCGWGRHLMPLHRAGYDAIGVDSSPGMLAAANSKLIDAGYKPNLVACEATHLPFSAECIDLIVTTRAIYHGERRFIVRCIKEIERVLIPGGYLLASFASVNDWRYGMGIPIEKGTYVPEINQPEPGIPHHFSDADELLGWFKHFEIEALEEIFDECIPYGYTEPVRWAVYFVAAKKKSTGDDAP